MLITYIRKYFKVELYTDISEIPLYNWEKLCATSKIDYLFKGRKPKKNHKWVDKILNAYDTISDQYFKELEIDLENEEIFVLTYKLIEARQKYLNGDKSAMNFVRMFEGKIREIKQKEVKNDLVKNRMALSRWYQQRIDPKQTTLLEFCKLIKLMKEEAENGKSNEG